jgi:hypothetical protein
MSAQKMEPNPLPKGTHALQHIGNKRGLARSTISFALRNHPRISIAARVFTRMACALFYRDCFGSPESKWTGGEFTTVMQSRIT